VAAGTFAELVPVLLLDEVASVELLLGVDSEVLVEPPEGELGTEAVLLAPPPERRESVR
jgi:hypothetical protein